MEHLAMASTRILLLIGLFSCNAIVAVEYEELFKCNYRNNNVMRSSDIAKEMEIYCQALANGSNYGSTATLEDWNDPSYVYPNIHPYHAYIVDTVLSLPVNTVCDMGAGSGKIAKYLYALDPDLEITCIEHNESHLQQLQENFETRPNVMEPKGKVRAQIVNGALPYLSLFPDNCFEMVYTCTVMMHLPYIPAILAAQELARISSRYVLHIENKNVGPSPFDRTIILPAGMSPVNFNAIDYQSVYEKLGFKTIKCFDFKDPNTPATYVYYLGEKMATEETDSEFFIGQK